MVAVMDIAAYAMPESVGVWCAGANRLQNFHTHSAQAPTIVCMDNSWLPGRSGTAAGGLIAMARRKAAMTQAELAAAVGVSQTMISTYELGGREPSLTTLAKILKGAGCALRMELTPYDDHDDVLNAIVESDPRRMQRHLDHYESLAAGQRAERAHAKSRS
jgi:transcriptional regulator with XRE-family HTH domain